MNAISSVASANLLVDNQPTDEKALQDSITSFALHMADGLRDESKKADAKIEEKRQELKQNG